MNLLLIQSLLDAEAGVGVFLPPALEAEREALLGVGVGALALPYFSSLVSKE